MSMRTSPAIGLTLALLCCMPLAGQIAPTPLRQARLYALASAKSLDHVNRNDVRAAMKTWFDIMARQRGFLLDSRVDIADTIAEIRQRLETHSTDVLALSVSDYLELEGSHLLVPALAHGRGPQGASLYSYILLVNPSVPKPAVAALRGKAVLAFSRGGANTGPAWVEVLLSKEKLGRATAFFTSLKVTDTAQTCILPVFFGKADACAVDEISFNLAREMNPQLGRLQVVARSRPMLESLIATPVKPHPYYKELFDTLLSLHQDPRGRQLLMVFKTDRLVPIEPVDLESARELWRDYERLPAGTATFDSSREED